MVRVVADNLLSLPRGRGLTSPDRERGGVAPATGCRAASQAAPDRLKSRYYTIRNYAPTPCLRAGLVKQVPIPTFTYVYDPNNRLKEVKDRTTSETIVTCKYDALGRRVERNVLKPVEYQTGGITRYYYAGQRIVEERDGNDFVQAVYTYGRYIDEPLSMDHVPTSQPTAGAGSQPSMPAVRSSPEVTVSPTAGPEVLVSPTATAFPRGTGILPVTPSVTSVVNTPSPTAVPTGIPEWLPTIPPDPFATMAAAMLTPAPTDTPVAMATVPPDPYATQAAEMFATFPPMGTPTAAALPRGTGILPVTPLALSSPTPWATATAAASASPAGGGPGGGTPIPVSTSAVPTVPSAVPTVPSAFTAVPTISPTPLSHQHAENSQPALARYYYHANRLYSVSALTDSAGNVVERYQYNAYGLCTTFNANYELPLAFSRFGNPFTFTGRELDPETDLMHYRARPYGPRWGRFLTNDPIGYEGGMNLYEYVSSAPINKIDPTGNQGLTLNVDVKTDSENYIKSIKNPDDLISYLNNQTKGGCCIENLRIDSHGSPARMQIGNDSVVSNDENQYFATYLKNYLFMELGTRAPNDRGNIDAFGAKLGAVKFCKKCTIVLTTCNLGMGDIPAKIAFYTGCTVYAPAGYYGDQIDEYLWGKYIYPKVDLYYNNLHRIYIQDPIFVKRNPKLNNFYKFTPNSNRTNTDTTTDAIHTSNVPLL